MIQISNTQTYGWEAAVRGMRNPMSSWKQSDSDWCYDCETGDLCQICPYFEDEQDGCTTYCRNTEDFPVFVVGEKDFSLMKKLTAAGSDHRKFLRMIVVSADLNAPLYWWKEYDTYKVGTVANSCSTMHKIHAKEFTLDDFSHEHLFGANVDWLKDIIEVLNAERNIYLHGGKGVPGDSGADIEPHDKRVWWQLIQLLPSSYNQKRTVMLNYEVLRNIYHARKNHKLDEWHTFCAWVESLPYAKELIVGDAT